MTLYSVYERQAEAPMVVADRFSWFAALLPPLYALTHGLWLGLLFYVLGLVALAAISIWVGTAAGFWLYVLFALLIGFEVPTLRRLKLRARGWVYRSEIIAAGEDLAQVEFLKRQAI